MIFFLLIVCPAILDSRSFEANGWLPPVASDQEAGRQYKANSHLESNSKLQTEG